MRIDVISLFPDVITQTCAESIVGRAQRRGLVHIAAHSPREQAIGRHRVVDDRPYGGGPGMVMAAPPLAATIDQLHASQGPAQLLLTSPQGRRLDQSWLMELARGGDLRIICGHYEGIDERIVEIYQPQEFSIGDYVLSGGELPALCLIDGLVRLLPGALGDAESALSDSFSGAGNELDHPCYTKPRVFRDRAVPEVLLSGDHARIAAWREDQRRRRTSARRPDLDLDLEG